MNVTRDQVIAFVKKYNNPNHRSIVTGVPITDENMSLVDGIRDYVCPIRRRWRGPGWKWGYHLKEGATKISVYPKGNICVDIEPYFDKVVLRVSHVHWVYPNLNDTSADWETDPEPLDLATLDLVEEKC